MILRLFEWIFGGGQPQHDVGDRTPSAIHFPQLPDRYAGIIRAASESDPGRAYEVDLIALSCTCPDFRKHRRQLPPLHAGRMCKHISEQLQETGAIDEYDDLRQAIARVGRGKSQYWRRLLPSGTEVVYGFDSGAPWVDVFVREEDGFFRYGYNIEEERWSYSEEPAEAYGIARLVGQLLRM